MSAPFEALQEMLLKGGIAPRHVKRYLRELSDHLADLTETQAAAGLNAADAAMMARARLGTDAELADAMLKQRDFRSFSVRFPWAVFLLTPPLAVSGLHSMGVSGDRDWLCGGALGHGRVRLPPPDWFRWAGSNLMLLSNFVLAPAMAWWLAVMSERQRLKPLWPLLGIALLLTFGFRGSMDIGPGRLGVGLTSISPLMPRPFGGPVSIHWPTLLAQAVLLSLPAIWLLRAWRRNGARA